MPVRVRSIALVFISTLALLLSSMPAGTEELRRTDWVPNHGALEADELPLVDLWTFRCPFGGHFRIRVDTKDDDDQGRASIDPVLHVISGTGQVVASGDDEQACTYEPVCGFGCPLVEAGLCGPGLNHSIIIFDRGPSTSTDQRCRMGGGYDFVLQVFGPDGRPLPRGLVQLGGGAAAQIQPGWLREAGFALRGLLLNDTAPP